MRNFRFLQCISATICFSSGGSEHLINGHRYAGEIHLLHYNKKYGSVTNALLNSDGIASVAVFFELAEEATNDGSYRNSRFIHPLLSITKFNSTITLSGKNTFTIKQLIRKRVTDFYSYKGSVTTPPCSQVVKWIIAKKSVKIYPSELAVFRSLMKSDGTKLNQNFRPLQELNNRTVYSY